MRLKQVMAIPMTIRLKWMSIFFYEWSYPFLCWYVLNSAYFTYTLISDWVWNDLIHLVCTMHFNKRYLQFPSTLIINVNPLSHPPALLLTSNSCLTFLILNACIYIILITIYYLQIKLYIVWQYGLII